MDESQSFATEVKTALSKLKEKDIRIILGNFNETWALKIFCEAYKYVFQDLQSKIFEYLILNSIAESGKSQKVVSLLKNYI